MLFIFFSYDKNFSFNFLNLASSISNIGISIEVEQKNLTFVFIILVIIGGSFFSTSSGLRFLKLVSLFNFSINEIISNAKPKNVFINKLFFSEKILEKSDFYKYFLSILIFIISLIFLSTIVSISGLSFEQSFKLSVLTLMNTVNSHMTLSNTLDFEQMSNFVKYFLIMFMIIGRVELLTILIIFKKFFLKN